MYYGNILEEELKNKVASEWFSDFDCTAIKGRVDFCVVDKTPLFGEMQNYLWAEAKRGSGQDFDLLFTQLILTIGRARTFDQHTPPTFLGAFNAERIVFIPYSSVIEIFYINDFNWQVTPSDYSTREFALALELVKKSIDSTHLSFDFGKDGKELTSFIRKNFKLDKARVSKIRITRNNFISVYQKWVERVKPSIEFSWEAGPKYGILDSDFYLADLLVRDGYTIQDKLNVVLRMSKYKLDRRVDEDKIFHVIEAGFNDSQKAYNEFWAKYQRPPRKQDIDWMITRRDLLVSQDIRERKGSYFTPQIWVEKSQEYLAQELGDNWQEEYYIWDCAAGTGNLLNGLTEKHRVWASTLDMSDVKVMHERIAAGANLLESHVFQFDFLNDGYIVDKDGAVRSDLSSCPKIPADLRAVITDPKKRQKLIIYINPPYAEAASATSVTSNTGNKALVATSNKTYSSYKSFMGEASNELFAQFLVRIYRELPLCKIGEFSTLKTLLSSNFSEFRNIFRAKLGRIFLVRSKTFDNVKGDFPIGFKIWDTAIEEQFSSTKASIYEYKQRQFEAELIGYKYLFPDGDSPLINKWYALYYDKVGFRLGTMHTRGNDFQNQKYIRITIADNRNHTNAITLNNLTQSAIYLSIRQSIPKSWSNDRDQFLYPIHTWQEDLEFQSDCLAFTLFHGQNRITRNEGINHWIPFTEKEVNAPSLFESNFMSDYIRGHIKGEANTTGGEDLFGHQKRFTLEVGGTSGVAINFSPVAQTVIDKGRALWSYYMEQSNIDVNASLYDIKAYFQGYSLDGSGKPKMNNKSEDTEYNRLMNELRTALKALAEQIRPKVYEHGFLKGETIATEASSSSLIAK